MSTPTDTLASLDSLPVTDLTVPEDAALVERYLEHVRVEKRLALRTVELYALDLIKLADHAGQAGVALREVQTTHIRRWVAHMHAGGRSARGIALVVSGWRGFYVWLGRQGWVTSNPVADVRTPKVGKPLPKALNVDESVQLVTFQNQDNTPWLEARDAAMVALLYGGGLRVGELVGLDALASTQARGWVDLQAGEAHVLGKGGKRRSVPIGAGAVDALHAWLALRNHGGAPVATALFVGRNGTRLTAQSVWQRLKRRAGQAGVSAPVHPHMLRHSFASHVLQSSGDLRAVQELLGHANISTTQVYTRLDFQHLAKAYDAAHPRAKIKPQSVGDSASLHDGLSDKLQKPATLVANLRKACMRNQIVVVLDKGVEYQFNVADAPEMSHEAARMWLDQQFTELDCEPLRASGKVLTADKVLVVTQAAGAALLADPTWSQAYASAVHTALAKPMIRVDVPAMAITY